MAILAMIAIGSVTCWVTDSLAYNTDEPYVVFWVDGHRYAEMDVAELSEDTLPEDPYKEGYTFVCWMDAWNNPVDDLLTYDYHDGGNLMWAYFEGTYVPSENEAYDGISQTTVECIAVLIFIILMILFVILIRNI